MSETLQSLLTKGAVILDGATGTELMARGLASGECPEQWNLAHPDRVQDVHRSYYEAGSQIVLTNTFGGSRLKLEPYGLHDKVKEINRAAARLLKEACPEGCLGGGDIGPMGKFLKPTGPYEPGEFEEIFEEQAFALKEGGADLIAIETMYDLQEARAALRAALKTGLPVFVTLTFNRKKKGFFTMMGNTPAESFRILTDEGAAAVGANCSLEVGQMLELLQELGDLSSFAPFIVKPNAGQPRIEGDRTVYDADPADFAQMIKKMLEAGAVLAGGCCGTSPVFIKKLAAELKGEHL